MRYLKNILFVFFLSSLSGCYNVKNIDIERIKFNYSPFKDLQLVNTEKYNLKKVYEKYSKTIKYIAKYNGISENLIYSFLVVENGKFDPNAVSTANAIGLLQVKAITANDIVIMAHRSNKLTDFDKRMLHNFLGKKRSKQLLKIQVLGCSDIITDADLKKPELNLVIGALFLKILHEETNGNIAEMGLRYLNGYFAFNCGKNITEKRLNSSKYVSKLNNIHKEISMPDLQTKTLVYHG